MSLTKYFPSLCHVFFSNVTIFSDNFNSITGIFNFEVGDLLLYKKSAFNYSAF